MNKDMDKKMDENEQDEKTNIYKLFRKILSILSWSLIVIIMLVSIGTILNSYGIINFKYFNNYLIMQLTLLLGFLLWGIKLYFYSYRYPSYRKYSIIFFIFGFIQLVFLVSNVY